MHQPDVGARLSGSRAARFASIHRVGLSGILVAGAALATMLHDLGSKGLWGDEIWEVWWSLQKPIGAMLTQAWAPPDLPLNFILVRLATNLGTDGAAIRLPEAILGIGTVVVVFLIARRVFGLAEAIAAALLLAVAPLQVWYAQDARPYAGISFYATLALYFFLILAEAWSWWAWLGLVLAFTLGVYNHLFGLFPVGILGLVAIVGTAGRAIHCRYVRGSTKSVFVRADLRFVGGVLAATAAAAVLSAPLWAGILGYLQAGAPGEVAPPPFVVSPGFVAAQLSLYGAGEGWRLYLFAGSFAIGFITTMMRRPWLAFVFGAWLCVPFIALAILQPRHIFIPRYFLFLQPVYLLTVAVGAVAIALAVSAALDRFLRSWRVPTRTLVTLAAVGVLCAVNFRTTAAGYSVDKQQDWSAICDFIAADARPGDIVTGNGYARDALNWCLRDDPVLYVPGRDEPLAQLFDSGQNVWYVETADGAGAPPLSAAGFVAVPDQIWAKPGLIEAGQYAAFAFPVSETHAHVLYRATPTLPARLVLHDVVGTTVVTGWPDYGQIGPGATRSLQYGPPAGTSRLVIRFLDAPGRDLAVSIDHAPVGTVSTAAGTGNWVTVAFAIPPWTGSPVQVDLRDLGDQPAAVAEIHADP